MKSRVNITDTKFHVDMENEVVVCELKCDMQLNKHPAWTFLNDNMWRKKFPKVSWTGEFTVKAVARCNAADTFDVEKGKRIAESRAKAKMFDIASRVYKLCADAITRISVECRNSSIICEVVEDNENNHVLELTR